MIIDLGGVRGYLNWFGIELSDAYVRILDYRLDSTTNCYIYTIEWYLSKQLCDMKYDPIACRDFRKLADIPYAQGSDPVDMAKAQIIQDNWFANPILVDPTTYTPPPEPPIDELQQQT